MKDLLAHMGDICDVRLLPVLQCVNRTAYQALSNHWKHLRWLGAALSCGTLTETKTVWNKGKVDCFLKVGKELCWLSNGTPYLWDNVHKTAKPLFKNKEPVRYIFPQDNERVFCILDNDCQLWNVETGKQDTDFQVENFQIVDKSIPSFKMEFDGKVFESNKARWIAVTKVGTNECTAGQMRNYADATHPSLLSNGTTYRLEEKGIAVFDTKTGEQLGSVLNPSESLKTPYAPITKLMHHHQKLFSGDRSGQIYSFAVEAHHYKCEHLCLIAPSLSEYNSYAPYSGYCDFDIENDFIYAVFNTRRPWESSITYMRLGMRSSARLPITTTRTLQTSEEQHILAIRERIYICSGSREIQEINLLPRKIKALPQSSG